MEIRHLSEAAWRSGGYEHFDEELWVPGIRSLLGINPEPFTTFELRLIRGAEKIPSCYQPDTCKCKPHIVRIERGLNANSITV